MGLELEDISPAECLSVLTDHVDVAAFRVEQAEARKQGRYLGLGFATSTDRTPASTGTAGLWSEPANFPTAPPGQVNAEDRKSAVRGKRVRVGVHSGGSGILQKKKNNT